MIENNSDPYGDQLAVTSVGGGLYGLPTIVSNTTVEYTAYVSHGTDAFTYTMSDRHGGKTSATVHMTIKRGSC